MEELREYLARPMTPPDPTVIAALGQPIAPDDALAQDAVDRLLDPAPLPQENGWCWMPDGVAYAAVRTDMPGVTGEMLEWWFDWHAHDPLRYQLWFPGAHRDNRAERATDGVGPPHWRQVHYPVEDVGLGMQALRIRFVPPTAIGFSRDIEGDAQVATVVCAIVGFARQPVDHTVMTHVFLHGEAGLVQRSRFWIGARLGVRGAGAVGVLSRQLLGRRLVRRRAIPPHAPRVMAEHCAAEYANLAALLPELYPRYGVTTPAAAR